VRRLQEYTWNGKEIRPSPLAPQDRKSSVSTMGSCKFRSSPMSHVLLDRDDEDLERSRNLLYRPDVATEYGLSNDYHAPPPALSAPQEYDVEQESDQGTEEPTLLPALLPPRSASSDSPPNVNPDGSLRITSGLTYTSDHTLDGRSSALGSRLDGLAR
jgi:hypothetical protein